MDEIGCKNKRKYGIFKCFLIGNSKGNFIFFKNGKKNKPEKSTKKNN